MKKVLMGNHAAALGAALARTDVVAAYPITPATQVGEMLAEMNETGAWKGKFLRVESEHSAMSALLGAATAGARTFTATSSQGLAYMHELLHWVSGARQPVVMVDVNRALAAPWSLWNDQQDSLSQRDTGWLQFYCSTNQEVLDTVLMAFKISEALSLPSMVILDGFTLSHTYEPVDVPEQEAVDAFLPPRRAEATLDPARPYTFGALAQPKEYMRLRRRLAFDMDRAFSVITDVCSKFEKVFGRSYGLFETYKTDDAQCLLVTAGASGQTAMAAVDGLRKEGSAAGALRLRVVRPFPSSALRRLVRPDQTLAVVDRSYSPGGEGILCQELRAALYSTEPRPRIDGFIAGLGGGEVSVELLQEIWREACWGNPEPAAPMWMEDAR